MRTVRNPRWLGHVLAALISCAVGCAINPKPEPPDATLDPTRVEVGTDGGDTTAAPSRGNGLVVSGGPGAASPPGATVRAYNLDSTEGYVETTVAADGSFELVVPGVPGDEIRVQVIGDGVRSQPADAEAPPVTGIDGSPGGATGVASDNCVQVEPPAELVLAEESGVIEIRNSCAAEVVIAAPTTRVEPSALAVGTGVSWPATVPPGDSLAVTVEVVPPAVFVEEIVFLWIGTTPERWAITVRAPD